MADSTMESANRPSRLNVLQAVIATVGLFAHLFASKPLYSWTHRLLGWALLLVCLLVLRKFLVEVRKQVPLLGIVCVQFYILFGLSQLSVDRLDLRTGVFVPTSETLTRALPLVLACEVVVVLSYHWVETLSRRLRTSFWRLYPSVDGRWEAAAYWYAGAATVMWYLMCLNSGFIPVGVRHIVVSCINPHLALTLLFYLRYGRGIGRASYAAFLMMFAMAVIGALQGGMANIVIPIFIAILARWVWSGRGFSFGWAASAVLVFLFLNPIKPIFRHLAWVDTGRQGPTGVLDTPGMWEEAIDIFMDSQPAWADTFTSTSSRLGGLMQLAQVIEFVPGVVPYKRGEGLETALLFWIPRVVWPDKPLSTNLYDRYAVEFDYTTHEGTKYSTTGMLFIVEGYWDFGVLGVVAYAMAFGSILGLLFGGFKAQSDEQRIASIVFCAGMFEVLYAISNLIASLSSFLMGTWLAFWLLAFACRSWNRGGRPRPPQSRRGITDTRPPAALA